MDGKRSHSNESQRLCHPEPEVLMKSTTSKLLCPDCKEEMNYHAEKLIKPSCKEAVERIDLQLDGSVEEVHTCAECGQSMSRQVT